jgi:hypothetical protein
MVAVSCGAAMSESLESSTTLPNSPGPSSTHSVIPSVNHTIDSYTQIKQQQLPTTTNMKFATTSFSVLALMAHSARGFTSPASMSRTFTRAAALRMAASTDKLPLVAAEDVMSPKAHGTSEKPVMKELRWGCDYDTADRICNFNRHYAEYAGTWVLHFVDVQD